MIRLDRRSVDVQGTERVFKKVVHSGQNAIRFVDRDGVPMRVPNTAGLSRLHSTYTLSPRGVPIRKSNHSYSGQLTQAKMQNMVNSLETSSQEMTSYTSMRSYGNRLSSAGSSRHYLSTANSQKRRSFGPPRSVKSMAKSASSQRSQRMATAPAPDLSVEPELENTNESPQGKRLEKEWSALSQCRALKRSSEIVSHRVDRMYFMSGNKLKLQSKYHVEDGELQHLREMQVARASSRASRDNILIKYDDKTYKRERPFSENDKLEKIERKLSSIEHRLSYIEEKSGDVKHARKIRQRSIPVKNIGEDDMISRSSSESGIHEGRDCDVDDRHDIDVIDKELSKRQAMKKEVKDYGDENNIRNSVKKSEIQQMPTEVLKEEIDSGLHVSDIMSHEENTTRGTVMFKVFENYPNSILRTKPAWNMNKKGNKLTLGIPRGVRRAKFTSRQKQMTIEEEQELICKPIPIQCGYCKCDKQRWCTKNQMTTDDNQQEYFVQNFPSRKQHAKIFIAPVECICRSDHAEYKGPRLSITGHQLPLVDRDMYI
ncbi:uncharacterized protein LOC132726818 isoform X1 [Ruditapes philippinarum]|uniref:uncharacterized protein LOC132726818 isoform X1 n=1 Tax=Ruditapes philippinarum TaxID=129788 RepID=UPI00295B5A5F|nr:uncharacterized protein LOC132726818 isoform X1 [Ruditapes philippinarum]